MDAIYRFFAYLPISISLTVLFTGLLFPQMLNYLPLFSLGIAFLWASLIFLISRHVPWRFTVCLLLILVLYSSTWIYMVLLHRSADLEVPFPLQKISRISGFARFDSTKSEKGNMVIELFIDHAYDRHGDNGIASGSLLLVYPDGAPILFGQRIEATGTVMLFEDTYLFFAEAMSVIPSDDGILRLYHRWRHKILKLLVERLDALPTKVSLLSTALMVGRFESWSPLRKLTTESGCAHVLALSGMHLQAIIGAFTLLLHKVVKKQKICLFTIPLALFYVAIVGNKPSLVRALIMVVATALVKRSSPKYTLAIVLVVHTWVAPQTIGAPGAVLSYGALGGIFFFSPIIAKYLTSVLPRNGALLIATAIGASLCTAPLSLGLFGSWYGVGILLSPLLAPIAMLMLLLTFLWLLYPLHLFSTLAVFLANLFEEIVTWGSSWSTAHEQFNTAFAWMIATVSLLTVVAFLKYACRTEWRRSYRKYDMGFSLRFPPSNNTTA